MFWAKLLVTVALLSIKNEVVLLFLLFYISDFYVCCLGMPHMHILLILDKNDRVLGPTEVDEYICARIPPLPPIDDYSPEAFQQRRLWYHVTTLMLHDCNDACMELRNGRRVCKKYFPKPFSDVTALSGLFVFWILLYIVCEMRMNICIRMEKNGI